MKADSELSPERVLLSPDQFKAWYAEILHAFIELGTEEPLLESSKLGKLALDNGIGLLDIVATHMSLLEDSITPLPVDTHAEIANKASHVLLECLAAYEISSGGFMDILEEVRSKSEEDVKAIFASAQDAVLLFSQQGVLLDFNNAYTSMLGYSREELKQRSVDGMPIGTVPGITEDTLLQLAERGYFDEYETEFARRDGSTVVATISGARLGSAHGEQAWRAFAFVKDITERKHAEETLRKSEERFRTLYESSIDGIVNLDTEGRIVDADQAYLDMLGYTLEEIRHLTYLEITPGKWRDMEDALIETQVKTRGYSQLYEKEYVRKDGTVFPVSVRRWVTRDEEGHVAGIWSIVRNVTERKRTEEELRRINAELDGFAHTVSHDLRSPLSSIVLAAELLRDAIMNSDAEALREEAREAERSIRRAIHRSYELIDDLLALAESGQQPTAPVEVDIGGMVASILEEHALDIEDRHVSFELSGDMGVVIASQTHMYQLFSNLIRNAVSHNNSPDPAVKVLYRGTDALGRHMFSVCDNGPGIPEEDLDNVFKPFFKKGGSSRTGVGLAIVDKVTAIYGGKIRVYNDNGACFDFTLKDWNPPRDRPPS